MKYLLLLLLFLTGCGYPNQLPVKDTISSYDYVGVVEIDGCQYLIYNYKGIAHKGNCKNKIHIYNVEK